jgi:hypothetical protein
LLQDHEIEVKLAHPLYLEVGQIHRFASDKAFASYCRLAPTVSQSGVVTRQGKNRRRGNRWISQAFSEAAQMAVQRYPLIREQFHPLLKRKKKRILAKSILAHKLAVAVFHVPHDEQPSTDALRVTLEPRVALAAPCLGDPPTLCQHGFGVGFRWSGITGVPLRPTR